VTERRIAPFGTWSSPIPPSLLATASVDLAEPWIDSGSVYWCEARPSEAGRAVVMRKDPWSAPEEVTPHGFSVRSKVHEYGGGAYTVHEGTVLFVGLDDQRVYRHAQGAAPAPITPESVGRHRYADLQVTPDGAWVVCVRERHEDEEVINDLVAIPAEGGDAVVLARGRDLYAAPRLSPDGSRIAWLSWDLPWMPWDGCELWDAALDADGRLHDEHKVAGADGVESIWQPGWSPAGELHFVSDRSGWWNLYRRREGRDQALHPMEAEFGWPHWVFGGATYAFLDDGRIVCIYSAKGRQHVGVLDADTQELIDLDLPHEAIRSPYLATDGVRCVFVAGGPSLPEQLVAIDFTTRAAEVIREAESVRLDPNDIADPSQIAFPTEDGLTAHAHFYPPASATFRGPDDERPPLIVKSHGGPTSASQAVMDLETLFWTTRGFAVVDVNYGGSTGYGRAYRERLNGRWGVTDTLDCINAARFLAAEGVVDGDRLLIRGGSAGGYTTLCALTFHDAFAAGASYFGISDLEPFAKPGGTHKFESRYEHTLIGPYPEAADLYRARSPIHSVDLIDTPMLVLQGADDEVVPPSQAELIVDALEAKGLPYAYLLFEGEQHGFRKADTIRVSREAELSFYAQILGFEPGEDLPRLEILHFPERGSK
jgi:dipeptidyl aminopeptidase/acylaminoacyl peptidase